MAKRLYIIGAGGHGKVVADAARGRVGGRCGGVWLRVRAGAGG